MKLILLAAVGGYLLGVGTMFLIAVLCRAAAKPLPNPDDERDQRAFGPQTP